MSSVYDVLNEVLGYERVRDEVPAFDCAAGDDEMSMIGAAIAAIESLLHVYFFSGTSKHDFLRRTRQM